MLTFFGFQRLSVLSCNYLGTLRRVHLLTSALRLHHNSGSFTAADSLNMHCLRDRVCQLSPAFDVAFPSNTVLRCLATPRLRRLRVVCRRRVTSETAKHHEI